MRNWTTARKLFWSTACWMRNLAKASAGRTANRRVQAICGKDSTGQDYFALLETFHVGNCNIALPTLSARCSLRRTVCKPGIVGCIMPLSATGRQCWQERSRGLSGRGSARSTDHYRWQISRFVVQGAVVLYRVAETIKSGALNLLHSEKFRSLDEYMIQKADWEANRAEYLQRARLEGFTDCRPP